MKIVGVGVGPRMMSAEAAEAIGQAEVVYGSPRAIKLAESYISGQARTLEDYSRIRELPPDAVVLSTGDPNLSGLGKYAGEEDQIIPGISSLQVACARLKVDLAEVEVINAHGRNPTPAVVQFRQAIASGSTVFLLPSPDFGAQHVASILLSIGLDVPIAILERLGYPDEKVEVVSAKTVRDASSRLHCLMVGPAIRLPNI